MILCGFGCVLEIENETGFSQFMVQAGMERVFFMRHLPEAQDHGDQGASSALGQDDSQIRVCDKETHSS